MNKLVRFLVKSMFFGFVKLIRVLAVMIVLITAFGVADRNISFVHNWVDSTPVYKITVETVNINNILDGGIKQLEIKPVQAIANTGNLVFLYIKNYIESEVM